MLQSFLFLNWGPYEQIQSITLKLVISFINVHPEGNSAPENVLIIPIVWLSLQMFLLKLFSSHSPVSNRCTVTVSAAHLFAIFQTDSLSFSVKQLPRVFLCEHRATMWGGVQSQKQSVSLKIENPVWSQPSWRKKAQHLFCQNRRGWDEVHRESNLAWRVPFWEM